MTAAPFSDFREQLAGALTSPVRWRETMIAMADHGASTFIDVGPDDVLARLVSRNVEGATALSLEEERVGHA
jgi:malonyl CoA-acyl carrier protein transacylase